MNAVVTAASDLKCSLGTAGILPTIFNFPRRLSIKNPAAALIHLSSYHRYADTNTEKNTVMKFERLNNSL